jgi:hypothetical protein
MGRPLCLAALALALLLPAAPVAAGNLGIRGGLYTDVEEPFVGLEYLARVGNRVYFNPNVEYVFVENATYLTFNADAHYDFETHSRAYLWAGAGLAALHFDPEGRIDGETDAGLNLLFGVGAKGDVIPYLQGKLVVADESEFVIAFGLRF